MAKNNLRFSAITQKSDTVAEMAELLRLTAPQARRGLYIRACIAWQRERPGELLKSIYSDIASYAKVSTDTIRRACGKK